MARPLATYRSERRHEWRVDRMLKLLKVWPRNPRAKHAFDRLTRKVIIRAAQKRWARGAV